MKEKEWIYKVSPKYWLAKRELIRDITTGLILTLSFLIAFLSSGFITGWRIDYLLTWSFGISSVGLFVSIRWTRSHFANRGEEDEEKENENLVKIKDEIKKRSKKHNRVELQKALKAFNIENYQALLDDSYENITKKLDEKILALQADIDALNTVTISIYRFFKLAIHTARKKIKTRRHAKFELKKRKLSKSTLFVDYKFVKLEHLFRTEQYDKTDRMSRIQRYTTTPAQHSKRYGGKTDYLKVFMFIGFNGAVMASIGNPLQMFLYAIFLVSTILVTALVSYVFTRNWSKEIYTRLLEDKLKDIDYILSKIESNSVSVE